MQLKERKEKDLKALREATKGACNLQKTHGEYDDILILRQLGCPALLKGKCP